jgi:hypothetical protein
MRSKVGIWIDHEKAVIVFVSRDGQQVSEIDSDITPHHRQSGEIVPGDDLRLNQATEHLNRYYDKVVAAIHHVELAFIFGPGEAKGELEKRLEHAKFKGRVVAVEPADHMTIPQIAAKARDHFFDQLEAKYAISVGK